MVCRCALWCLGAAETRGRGRSLSRPRSMASWILACSSVGRSNHRSAERPSVVIPFRGGSGSRFSTAPSPRDTVTPSATARRASEISALPTTACATGMSARSAAAPASSITTRRLRTPALTGRRREHVTSGARNVPLQAEAHRPDPDTQDRQTKHDRSQEMPRLVHDRVEGVAADEEPCCRPGDPDPVIAGEAGTRLEGRVRGRPGQHDEVRQQDEHDADERGPGSRRPWVTSHPRSPPSNVRSSRPLCPARP